MAEFIPKAIDLVKQAVSADEAKNYERAKYLYAQSLEYFMTGLKYEKNETSKATIRARVSQYMQRAEEVNAILEAQAAAAQSAQQKKTTEPGSTKKEKEKSDDDAVDADTKKLQDSLSHVIMTERPNVKWEDVAGLDNAKMLTKEAVLLPLQYPQLFTGNRKPWKGILYYGPPGTGKSHLARAIATEVSNATFFSVSAADLVTKWQGDSERNVQALFQLARKKKPSIIFIDEIDSICGERKDNDNDASVRMKTQLMKEWDGVGADSDGVIVIGATNAPWALDQAIRRRFEKRIYIPLPEERARANMLKINLDKTPNNLTAQEMESIAKRTDGYSGHDVSVLVKGALYQPLRVLQEATHFKKVPGPNFATDPESYTMEACAPSDPAGKEMTMFQVPAPKLKAPDVSYKDLYSSLQVTPPSVDKAALARYEDWTREFGQDG
jgi:vacuolar protein-sorting-associated protein 4